MSARTDAEATNNQLSSGVTPEHLQTVLKDKLEAQHVEIADLSGTIPHPSPSKHPPTHASCNRIQSPKNNPKKKRARKIQTRQTQEEKKNENRQKKTNDPHISPMS